MTFYHMKVRHLQYTFPSSTNYTFSLHHLILCIVVLLVRLFPFAYSGFFLFTTRFEALKLAEAS